jgi:peptidoglycan/xylan/chitin deacetylase (PgdA/CDA1 family)
MISRKSVLLVSITFFASLILGSFLIVSLQKHTIDRSTELKVKQSNALLPANLFRSSEIANNKKQAELEKIRVEKVYQELIAPDVPKLIPSSGTFVRKIDTKKPVVFLTIDDGEVKSKEAADFIHSKRLNPTLFLTDKTISDNYDYFKQFQKDGIQIEDHTITHTRMTRLGLEGQRTEICGQRDKINTIYGLKPTLFRPPYGDFNSATLEAASQCGMKAVVNWSAKVNGGSLQYQNGKHLVAGDIVLMHFRKEVMQDLQAFYDEITAQNLTPAFLTSWL